jgi:hypothetical protein
MMVSINLKHYIFTLHCINYTHHLVGGFNPSEKYESQLG